MITDYTLAVLFLALLVAVAIAVVASTWHESRDMVDEVDEEAAPIYAYRRLVEHPARTNVWVREL